MTETIYGTLIYHEKNYPFFLEGHRVYIVGQAWEYQEDFDSTHTEEVIFGTTSGNRSIVFLQCVFSTTVFAQKVWFSPIGYAISQDDMGEPTDFNFDSILIYSEALNSFFPPQIAIDNIDVDYCKWNGSIEHKLKPFNETDISFDYNDCKCKVNIARSRKSSLGEINSTFAFEFDTSQKIEELPKYWLALFDFLSFVNYASNIVFEKIKLCKRRNDGIFDNYANAVIFSNNEYTPRPYLKALTVDDFPHDKIGVVFSTLANIRWNDARIEYYLPHNYKDNFFVDPLKWFTVAMNFDGLSESRYPDFKQNKDKAFRDAKQLVLRALNDVNLEGMNSSKRKYFNKCRNVIVRFEGLLEEKMNDLVEKYKPALTDLLNKNLRDYGVHADEYGEKYSYYRNKLAHGDILPVGDKEFAVYKVLQALIYYMLLDDTGLDDNVLQIITNKLFL